MVSSVSMNFSSSVESYQRMIPFNAYFKVLLIEKSNVSLECLDLVLELVLVFNLFVIHELEVLNLSFECCDLVLTEFMGYASVILKVGKLLSSEELLVVHLG